ncbi:MAG TPA: NAD-dependent epimerase/dehydratase family protein, partial [Planctomycetota bacterium]|nr:NAD-dependent epimerase/dehydratase family protein [Planctomycetota bacterium]
MGRQVGEVKALVTGGTGFLGRALVERLVARGDFVRVIARRAPNERLPDGVELHQGDISTPG